MIIHHQGWISLKDMDMHFSYSHLQLFVAPTHIFGAGQVLFLNAAVESSFATSQGNEMNNKPMNDVLDEKLMRIHFSHLDPLLAISAILKIKIWMSSCNLNINKLASCCSKWCQLFPR